MFTLLEGAVGDLAQQAGVVVQSANIAPFDLVGVGAEMVVAEGRQARKHPVDLDVRSKESVQGFGIVGGAAVSWLFSCSARCSLASGEGGFQRGADRPDRDIVEVEAVAVAGFQCFQGLCCTNRLTAGLPLSPDGPIP